MPHVNQDLGMSCGLSVGDTAASSPFGLLRHSSCLQGHLGKWQLPWGTACRCGAGCCSYDWWDLAAGHLMCSFQCVDCLPLTWLCSSNPSTSLVGFHKCSKVSGHLLHSLQRSSHALVTLHIGGSTHQKPQCRAWPFSLSVCMQDMRLPQLHGLASGQQALPLEGLTLANSASSGSISSRQAGLQVRRVAGLDVCLPTSQATGGSFVRAAMTGRLYRAAHGGSSGRMRCNVFN